MRTLLIFLLGLSMAQAQQTLQLDEGQSSPKAQLQDVEWIQGHWLGNALGGQAEEIWSPPRGTSMMFVFRLLHDDQVTFYEIGHIIEKEGTLLMQLKHFNGELKGWEKQEETVDFRLVKIEKNKVFFEGLTMEKVGEFKMKVSVLVKEEEKEEELIFEYDLVGSK